MKVLVCGSSGVVGRAVVQALQWRGHRVVGTVRHATPGVAGSVGLPLTLDFMRPTSSAAWAERLRPLDLDVVVNCVGILMPTATASFERIHTEGPLELFNGAAAAGIRRIVQVSALGVGSERPGQGEPAYLRSKRLADEAVLALGLDAAVVRPSLVCGPGSASGRLFATLASLPVISLPGRGEQLLQPIHVYELAEAIAALVERTGCARGVYELGGDVAVTYREMLTAYRSAQGLLGEAIWLPVPLPLMRLGALLAEQLPQRVFCRDTVRLLERGNAASRNAAHVLLGRPPASLREALTITPPQPAFDLRVSLPAPVEAAMRATLAFLWIAIAVISAALPERSGVIDLLARCGFAGTAGQAALALSCALNLGFGLATWLRPGVRLWALQAGAVVGYTLTAAISVPALTIDHCGPLVKNVPILMFIVALWLAEAARPRPVPARRAQTSMLATRKALLSMNWRRGSTSSPMSMVKTRSASMASSS